MDQNIIKYVKEKVKKGFVSKEEIAFFKIALQAITKQLEIEDKTQNWREKINPDENIKAWLMYGIMESFLIEKDVKKVDFTSEIRKIEEKLKSEG